MLYHMFIVIMIGNGFSIKYKNYKKLPKKGKYKVYVDAKHYNGNLITSHSILRGKKEEKLCSLPICVIHKWQTMNCLGLL